MNIPTAGKAIILSATILTSACSPHFYKSSATNQEARQDLANCRVVSAMVPYTGNGLDTAIIGMATLENCMIGKGYYEQ